MKNLKKQLFYIIGYLLWPLSVLFPRKSTIWIFGSSRGAFNDNAKYLFIYTSEQTDPIRPIWISENKSTVREIRSKGLEAYFILSFKGIFYALRGKYYFFNSYTSDISFFTSGGAICVNLWHGVGLKKIEFCIQQGPLAERYVRKTLKQRYYYPQVFRRPDYFLSSTDFQTVKFAEAFRIRPEQCLNSGYPRNDILLSPETDRRAFIEKYESASTKAFIDRIKSYRKTYLYMPTWRDSQKTIFSSHLDLHRLNDLMQQTDSLLILKPHVNTIINLKDIEQYPHIILLDSHLDIYTILPYTDVLITDYSSILYDYLLMKDKDIILYLYDYQEYIKERDFNYPFFENVAGNKAYTFEELYHTIQDCAFDRSQYTSIKDRFWGIYKGNACSEIYRTFKAKTV